MHFVTVVMVTFRSRHFGALFRVLVIVQAHATPEMILKQARIESRRFGEGTLWFEESQGWTTKFVATQQKFTTHFFPLYFNPNKHVLVRMLVNPTDPDFGRHEVFVKKGGIQAIRKSMSLDVGRLCDCRLGAKHS
jgi:hypothetical protein